MCGFGARRKCEAIILAGRVAINQQIVRNLATQVDLAKDAVQVDGENVQPQQKLIYVLLNKPKGYLSAVSDARGRKTVRDLVQIKWQIFPVGRLDYDTTGVLMLTNDGNLAYRLIHPKFKIPKEYLVYLNCAVRIEDIEKLQQGVLLADGLTAPCQAKILKNPRYVRLIIHEGRKRQIKRMFEALRYRVKKLNRETFAGLSSAGLDSGKWRFLTEKEVQLLRKRTGLSR